ncbi:MAG TPA: hypothetical protein VGA02_07645 [Gemmatimonadales bacterium]|jgi:hypothetical protein
MPFYRCEICQADGTTVARDVMVTIDETTRSGGHEWYGTITISHLNALAAGQAYRITLADGRTGEFTVRRNTLAGGTDRAVAIHGTSPLTPPR